MLNRILSCVDPIIRRHFRRIQHSIQTLSRGLMMRDRPEAQLAHAVDSLEELIDELQEGMYIHCDSDTISSDKLIEVMAEQHGLAAAWLIAGVVDVEKNRIVERFKCREMLRIDGRPTIGFDGPTEFYDYTHSLPDMINFVKVRLVGGTPSKISKGIRHKASVCFSNLYHRSQEPPTS